MQIWPRHSVMLKPPNYRFKDQATVLLQCFLVQLLPRVESFPEAMPTSIEEELAKGFTCPSTSLAPAGFFFAKKKDCGLCPCIDYRQGCQLSCISWGIQYIGLNWCEPYMTSLVLFIDYYPDLTTDRCNNKQCCSWHLSMITSPIIIQTQPLLHRVYVEVGCRILCHLPVPKINNNRKGTEGNRGLKYKGSVSNRTETGVWLLVTIETK